MQRVVVIYYRRFGTTLSVPSPAFRFLTPWDDTDSPETSVRNCHYLLLNNPEERSSQVMTVARSPLALFFICTIYMTFSLSTTWRQIGGVELLLHSFMKFAIDREVSGQLHAFPDSPPGNNPGTHLVGRWVGSRTSLDFLDKREISLSVGIRTPHRPTCCVVTILSTGGANSNFSKVPGLP
jgi:hypothetical protein